MPTVGGWHLPESDRYFMEQIPKWGTLPKKNGFERDHLMEAFKYVKAWDTAVDIGAHVGFWATDMADKFKHVHCFEAAPDTYGCLAKNMADRPNVTTYHKAVGDKAGFVSIMYDPKRTLAGNTGSRFVRPAKSGVPMVTIDSLDLPACDFIKMDIEGFEYFALVGASQTIKKFKPAIIMECKKGFAQRFNQEFGVAEKYLRKLGYQVALQIRPDKIFVPV
jgi:FkbM family methyltransferase